MENYEGWDIDGLNNWNYFGDGLEDGDGAGDGWGNGWENEKGNGWGDGGGDGLGDGLGDGWANGDGHSTPIKDFKMDNYTSWFINGWGDGEDNSLGDCSGNGCGDGFLNDSDNDWNEGHSKGNGNGASTAIEDFRQL